MSEENNTEFNSNNIPEAPKVSAPVAPTVKAVASAPAAVIAKPAPEQTVVEDAKPNYLSLAVDFLAAAVAVAFGVMIFLDK